MNPSCSSVVFTCLLSLSCSLSHFFGLIFYDFSGAHLRVADQCDDLSPSDMYIYIYICVCVCVCIYIYIYIYMYVCVVVYQRPIQTNLRCDQNTET